jgi:hypothetical protein
MICLRTTKPALHTILLRNSNGNTFYRHTLEGTADDASVQARYLFDDYEEAQEALIVDAQAGPDSLPVNFVVRDPWC